ncbi:hypothetical protein [Neisseria subflava]|nr:hypothetical protein [Neisseria subflava]
MFAAVFGTAQAADTETLEAMKAQNGSVKTVLMDVMFSQLLPAMLTA